jgi:hypothetical protein
VLKYTVAAVKDANEGIYELVLYDENGNESEVTRPGAIRLSLTYGDARLMLSGWTRDLSSLQTDPLATTVLPASVSPNDVLRVAIKTAGPASYSWIHRTGNGTVTRLTSQTGPALSFKDVIRVKGYYVLTVTTGGVSRTLTFQVLSFATAVAGSLDNAKPVLSYRPEPLLVPVGGAADFGVVATGNVGGYRWFKRVNGVDTELVSAGSSPWLTIDKVALSDEAEYWVQVVNVIPGGAPENSDPVLLDVKLPGE